MQAPGCAKIDIGASMRVATLRPQPRIFSADQCAADISQPRPRASNGRFERATHELQPRSMAEVEIAHQRGRRSGDLQINEQPDIGYIVAMHAVITRKESRRQVHSLLLSAWLDTHGGKKGVFTPWLTNRQADSARTVAATLHLWQSDANNSKPESNQCKGN